MDWIEVVVNVGGSVLVGLILGSILIRVEWVDDEGTRGGEINSG